MKHIFTLIILGLFTWHSVAAKNIPPSTPHFNISTHIYFDAQKHILYIDLSEVKEKIILFNIQQEEKVLYIEDISKSNGSSIVEYNYDNLPQGQYTLELVTASFDKITKTFTK